VLGLLLVLFGLAYLRGTWASPVARNPETSAEGTITQLYRTPQGDTQVRCAILVDAPAEKVWAVVRDYGNHPSFLPYVSEMTVGPGVGERVHLVGIAHSRIWGDWPFDVHMDHKKVSDKEYVANWDEPSETMTVNRGGWALTATGPQQTLVVFSLQVEAVGYPNFFVRNVVMDRLYRLVSALRDEVNRRQARQ
jgi:ribosome-associated toxin RatA of RatAB toxin-antitoxin module